MVSKVKMRIQSKKNLHDHKNLKNFSYQVDKKNYEAEKDKTEKEKGDEDETEKDKTHKEKENEDEADQEFSSWIESKDEFNTLKDSLLGLKINKLKTSTDKYQYDLSYMKNVIKNIANSKTTKDDAINSLKEDSGYIKEIKKIEKKR